MHRKNFFHPVLKDTTVTTVHTTQYIQTYGTHVHGCCKTPHNSTIFVPALLYRPNYRPGYKCGEIYIFIVNSQPGYATAYKVNYL